MIINILYDYYELITLGTYKPMGVPLVLPARAEQMFQHTNRWGIDGL
jgi:hypothetical protein